MRVRIDRRFLTEVAAYRFAHGCEQCVHFVTGEGPSQGLCAHGYPNESHRAEAFAREGREASFCKEWELA